MEKRQLNVMIDSRLYATLKKESDSLGTKFNRFIEGRLRNSVVLSGSVRKLGLPSAERQG